MGWRGPRSQCAVFAGQTVLFARSLTGKDITATGTRQPRSPRATRTARSATCHAAGRAATERAGCTRHFALQGRHRLGLCAIIVLVNGIVCVVGKRSSPRQRVVVFQCAEATTSAGTVQKSRWGRQRRQKSKSTERSGGGRW